MDNTLVLLVLGLLWIASPLHELGHAVGCWVAGGEIHGIGHDETLCRGLETTWQKELFHMFPWGEGFLLIGIGIGLWIGKHGYL